MLGNWRMSAGLLLALTTIVGCNVAALGAAPDKLAAAQAQAQPGAASFQRECASCHGQRGEGLGSNPPLMGPGALSTYGRPAAPPSDPILAQQQQQLVPVTGQPPRPDFKTAEDVFEYISTRMPMPKSRAGTLKPEEYWAILNFMLIAHGVSVPPGGVSAENAKSVPLPPTP